MKPRDCPQEPEALAAVLEGRWPAGCDPDLLSHVDACPICAEVVLVADAIDSARTDLTPSLPDSARVWRLAQTRARLEAVHAADRPMAAALAVAVVCALALVASYYHFASAWFRPLLDQFASGLSAVDPALWLMTATRLFAEHGALALAAGAFLLLVPAAAYLVLDRS